MDNIGYIAAAYLAGMALLVAYAFRLIRMAGWLQWDADRGKEER